MATDRLAVPPRLLGIVAISAVFGAATFGALLFGGERGSMDSGNAILTVTLISAIAWAYIFIPTLLCGFALYYIHMRWRLSRLTLLVAFLGVAILLAYLFFSLVLHAVWIALATATCAWLTYCFGPLAVWRNEFDETSDVDF